MNRIEAKTGQSIDFVKASLINPELVESILELPELKRKLSIIDIGSGDATSSQDLLNSLISADRRIKNLALVEVDINIFPELVGTVTTEPINSLSTQIIQAEKRDLVAEFLMQFEEKYDLALSQLVLNQIKSDSEASYLMYLAYRALKPNGNLFIVNLHPNYLQYLAHNEPNKFKLADVTNGRMVGTYNFDTSGSAQVYSRSIESQVAMLLELGFDFVKIMPITTEAIADQKPRYGNLAEKGVPMFYLMQLRKNADNFISSTSGVVQKIKPYKEQWIVVTFMDGDEIKVPRFTDWEKVNNGDSLILQETYRREIGTSLLNYWVVNPDEEVIGGQLIVQTK